MYLEATEFYSLIRMYFMEMSESRRVAVAPMFGQKRDAPITQVVYFEYLNERVIDIRMGRDIDLEDKYFVSDFDVYGTKCDMLTVYTECRAEELPALWEIRTRWLNDGLEPSGDSRSDVGT